jgi:3-methyladenine DNA glycosylase/8-oxoguanine DNA glycosylase
VSGVERVWTPGRPVDLRATLGPLVRGTGDPAHRFDAAGRFWWSCTTPAGDGTLTLAAHDPTSPAARVHAQAWGAGADWLLGHVPTLLGAHDDWAALDLAAMPVLHAVRRRRPGLRLPRTGLVMDALVPAVLEQKVTGQEARRSWRLLLHRFGASAPGPTVPDARSAMRVPPSARVLLDLPSWEWHRLGVDLKRQRAIRAAASVANRLEEAAAMAPDAALARLRLIPGIGEWTAAETAQRSNGHADAVSVGDYHLKNMIMHLFTGRPRGTDEQMLQLLAPWAGQRQRIMRLAELTGIAAPRFGPKFHYTDIRAI